MTSLERALALLGPLEGRIMREVWSGAVAERFTVRDVQALMPELAYTTVMTTINRLADKHVLENLEPPRQRAHRYRAAGDPDVFLLRAGRASVELVVERYGEAAMAAFADRFDRLSPEQLERLRELGRR